MLIKEYVSKYDPQNQFEVLKNTYRQIEFAWQNKIDLSALKGKSFSTIIISGLGGSAISGDLLQNFLGTELKIPFIVNRNYSLPDFANEKTLLVISSYSGNTEETIEVLKVGIKKGCKIVAVTTGGIIGKLAMENNIPLIKLKEGFQPRYALGVSFFSLLKVFQELNFIPDQGAVVNKIISLWKTKGVELSKDDNIAYKIASEILGFIPVIYSAADMTSAVGYRLKCQLNENSKLHAFHSMIPESNHNEIIGWETFWENQFNAKVINILDRDYNPQVKKRFKITSELINKSKSNVINIESNESDFKIRLMGMIYLCDWISYYVGILRGKDPSEIENIDFLKKHLSAS
jgi:glucose/mannose-6-phosphate isomerase